MTLIKKEPFQYECGKCKIPIQGGFEPTGFCFDHGGIKTILCRPCYVDYWNLFNEIEKKFVQEWFNA
jgi:hypothetical protein